MSPEAEPRLQPARWDPRRNATTLRLARLLVPVNVVLALWYLSWLLEPGRAAHPVLYGMLVVAELYNMAQAVGFWWTIRATRRSRAAPAGCPDGAVDVLIPTYSEPAEVVEPTLAAALEIRHPRLNVILLDDGGRPEMERLAHRHGARYLRRTDRHGAKAGAINAALERTDAPYVAVFDCDHVPDARFLEATLPHLQDERVALVQTPQYYANSRGRRVAAASWSQQSLFFGPIASGRDAMGAMFCCGTNVVFRRAALEATGGFPTDLSPRTSSCPSPCTKRGGPPGAGVGTGPGGHGVVRRPAAAVGPGLPLLASPDPPRPPPVPDAAQLPAVGRLLADGVDGADLRQLPGRPDPHRRAAGAGGVGRRVPRALGAVLRRRPRHGGPRGSGHLHLRHLRPDVVHVLGPRPGVAPHPPPPPGNVRGHAEGVRRRSSAATGGRAPRRLRRPRRSRRLRARPGPVAGDDEQRRLRVAPRHRPLQRGVAGAPGPGGRGIGSGAGGGRRTHEADGDGDAAAGLGSRPVRGQRRRGARRGPGRLRRRPGWPPRGRRGRRQRRRGGVPRAVRGRRRPGGPPRPGRGHRQRGAGVRQCSSPSPVGTGIASTAPGSGPGSTYAGPTGSSPGTGGTDGWSTPGPAADADVDAARALVLAGRRFGAPDLTAAGVELAGAVLDHETVRAGGDLVLAAGTWAVERRIVNPSYLAVCAFADLGKATGDARWGKLRESAERLLGELMADGRLPPDWAVLDAGGGIRPIGHPDQPERPARYGLDASRVPFRLAEECGERGQELAARLWPLLRRLDGSGAAVSYDLEGNRQDGADHPTGLVGAAAAARAAGDRAAAERLLSQAAELDRRVPTYYGSAWVALGSGGLGVHPQKEAG